MNTQLLLITLTGLFAAATLACLWLSLATRTELKRRERRWKEEILRLELTLGKRHPVRELEQARLFSQALPVPAKPAIPVVPRSALIPEQLDFLESLRLGGVSQSKAVSA